MHAQFFPTTPPSSTPGINERMATEGKGVLDWGDEHCTRAPAESLALAGVRAVHPRAEHVAVAGSGQVASVMKER